MSHFVLPASTALIKFSDIEVRIIHFIAGNPFADPQLFAKGSLLFRHSTWPASRSEFVMASRTFLPGGEYSTRNAMLISLHVQYYPGS